MNKNHFRRCSVVILALSVGVVTSSPGAHRRRALHAHHTESLPGVRTWQISSTNAVVNDRPSVAVDPNNNKIHLIWSEQPVNEDETKTVIQYSSFDGVRWSNPHIIAPSLANLHTPHDYAIVTDADSKIHVVWSEWYKQGGHYLVSNGTEWGASQAVSPTFKGKVALGRDSNGRAYMTFLAAVPGKLTWHGILSPHERPRETVYVLQYAMLGDGNWSVLGELNGAADGDFGASAIAVAPDDKIHILYEKSLGSEPPSIKYALVWAGRQTEMTLTSAGKYSPAIAVGKSGVVHCAWGDVGVSYCEIENGRIKDRIDGLVPDGRAPVLATESSGNVFLACLLIDEGRIGYLIKKNGKWGTMIKVGKKVGYTSNEATAPAIGPALIADRNGNPYLFWVEDGKLYARLMR